MSNEQTPPHNDGIVNPSEATPGSSQEPTTGTPPPHPGQSPCQTPRSSFTETCNGVPEKTWAIYIHLSALSGMLIPFGFIIGPIVLWMMRREKSLLIDAHGKEAINAQITGLIFTVVIGSVAFMLTFILIGFLLIPVVIVVYLLYGVLFPILAGLKAEKGEFYQYPLTLRFVSHTPPPAPATNPPPPVSVVSAPKSSNRTKKAWLFGCSGALVIVTILTLVGLLSAFGVAVFGFAFNVLRDSEAAQAALRESQASTVLIEEIGEPMKMGWFLEGGVNVDVANNSGDADILVPIKGPKGTASVHAIGIREGGVWIIQEMTATVEGTGNTVDLLAD